MIQKPEALGYILGKEPVLKSTLIVFISALLSSILILLTERSIYFFFLSGIVFLRIILIYWLTFSIVLTLGFKILYKTKISFSQVLSFIGILSPFFSILLALWEIIIKATKPSIIVFLIMIAPTFYFMVLLLNGLASIYQQPRKYMVSIILLAMIVLTPIAGILRYIGGLL